MSGNKLYYEIIREAGLRLSTSTVADRLDVSRPPEIARVAMIFVRSKDGGVSSIEDIVLGIRLLAEGLHKLGYRA